MNPNNRDNSIEKDLSSIATSLVEIAINLKKLTDHFLKPGVPVGLQVNFGKPTTHTEEKIMPTIKLIKGTKGKKAAFATGTKAASGGFTLQDNGDDTFTVTGVDSAGNPVDISSVAKITASSDTPTIVTVDPPVGMTSAVHAVGPLGTANLTVVATWNDGSIGPFTITIPITTTTGPASTITITFGTPTVH